MIQSVHNGWSPAAMRGHHPHRPSADSSSAAVAASASRDVSANLSITTKEGDTVSISASFDTTATYAGVRGRGGRADAWSVSSSSQVSLQVQGDLSAQELQDISRVVKTFMHDLRAMLNGGDASVADVANGNAQTLKSITANAETSTTFIGVAAVARRGPALDVGNAPPQRRGTEDSDLGATQGMALPAPVPELPTALPEPALA